MDVYQPSGFGRRRRRGIAGHQPTMLEFTTNSNSTAVEYSAPLSQHWKTVEDSSIETNNFAKLGLELSRKHSNPFPLPPETVVRSLDSGNVHKEEIGSIDNFLLKSSTSSSTTPDVQLQPLPSNSKKTLISSNKKFSQISSKEGVDDSSSTKFGDNIGFSVVMPAGKSNLQLIVPGTNRMIECSMGFLNILCYGANIDYYRKSEILSTSQECRGWATAALVSTIGAAIAGVVACMLSFKLRKTGKGKADPLVSIHSSTQGPIPVRTSKSRQTSRFFLQITIAFKL